MAPALGANEVGIALRCIGMPCWRVGLSKLLPDIVYLVVAAVRAVALVSGCLSVETLEGYIRDGVLSRSDSYYPRTSGTLQTMIEITAGARTLPTYLPTYLPAATVLGPKPLVM